MRFQKQAIITGTDSRIRKDGTPYHIVHVLTEDGTTASMMYKGDVTSFMTLKSMEKYIVDMKVTFGQYMRVEVLNIAPMQ